jgi:hypothetical protein
MAAADRLLARSVWTRGSGRSGEARTRGARDRPVEKFQEELMKTLSEQLHELAEHAKHVETWQRRWQRRTARPWTLSASS